MGTSAPAKRGVQVVYPPYDQELEGIAGKSIQQILEALKPVWSIAPNARVYVNGNTVTDMSITVSEGGRVEFARPTAEKGSF